MAGVEGGKVLGQVICVEQRGELRPFVSLDDLERLACDDAAWLMKSLEAARTVFESVKDQPAVVYVLEERR